MKIVIRYMDKKEHLSGVLDIEAVNSHMASPVSGQWTEEDFCYVMGQPNHLGLVAIDNNELVVGFAIYQLSEDKIHICNMAVHPDYTRMGIGTLLLNKLKSKLRNNRREKLETDVRETNMRACYFLRSQGFKATDVIRNWYETPQYEDAYKFQYLIKEGSNTNGSYIHREKLPDGSVRLNNPCSS